MFSVNNLSVNAREITTISSNFVDEYTDKISKSIILDDDLLCFKKKSAEEEEDSIICKSFNVTPLEAILFFNIDDNVGGESDQRSISASELESISVLRFNKKLGE